MSRLVHGWRTYWFRGVSRLDLVAARLVLVAIILSLDPLRRYARIGQLAPSLWQPIPLLAWLGVPQPDAATATALAWITLVLTVAVGLGLWLRVALPALAGLLVLEEAFCVSAGRIAHGTIPLLYATALLPLALRSLPRAGWYFDLVYLELAAFYGAAGVSKLVESGWSWTDGYSLQFYLLDKGRPAGAWLASHLGLCRLASTAVLLWELTFVFGMVRRLRPWFLAGGVIFHVATTVFLGVTFRPVVALYALFVPWSRAARRLGART